MQEVEKRNGPIGANGSVYIGKTLGYAARKLDFWAKGYRVYRLRDESDRDGVMLAEEYDLKRIIQTHPGLNRSRIVSCEEYFGIRIFRVRYLNQLKAQQSGFELERTSSEMSELSPRLAEARDIELVRTR